MISDCYCTNLRAAMRSVSAVYDASLEPVGINVAQWGLLRKLEAAGKGLSIQELADAAGLERSTVARNTKVLVKDGFVSTEQALDDRRVSVVSLTPKGDQALLDGLPLWQEAQRKVEFLLNGADAADDLRSVLRVLQTAA